MPRINVQSASEAIERPAENSWLAALEGVTSRIDPNVDLSCNGRFLPVRTDPALAEPTLNDAEANALSPDCLQGDRGTQSHEFRSFFPDQQGPSSDLVFRERNNSMLGEPPECTSQQDDFGSQPGPEQLGVDTFFPLSDGAGINMPFDKDGQLESLSRMALSNGMALPWDQAETNLRFGPNTLSVTAFPLYPQPGLREDDKIVQQFCQNTSTILSIRTGPRENPWLEVIWPMAQNHGILYHALAAMACSQASGDRYDLRQHENHHKAECLKSWKQTEEHGNPNVAIAVCLALAFSESWSREVETGSRHIEKAKRIIKKLLSDENRLRTCSESEQVVTGFLCKTWMYVDILARLTSQDIDMCPTFEEIFHITHSPLHAEKELDPLMGCAGTLFPTIGRVAQLARSVLDQGYPQEATFAYFIRQGNDLKQQLEKWISPPTIKQWSKKDLEDFTHSRRTANAYRWATMLLLRQTVPELDGFDTPWEMAAQILSDLSLVPDHSNALIMHIFPLLIASCEAKTKQTRDWIRNRWNTMKNRMSIGNIRRCEQIVEEVWKRRDDYIRSRMPHVNGNTMEDDPLSHTIFGASLFPSGASMNHQATAKVDSKSLYPKSNFACQHLDVQ